MTDTSLLPILGPHFVIGLQGLSLTNEEKKFMRSHYIGGVILFTRNIESPTQLRSLCQEIKDLDLPEPPLISVDMEGGVVQRLKPPAFPAWPSAARLALHQPRVTYRVYRAMARELRALGLDLNFAPTADVLTEPNNRAIGSRSFGTDADRVGQHVAAAVRGLREGGVWACAKHFPGHGNTLVDSHLELPVETQRALTDLHKVEWAPFRQAIASGVEAIMVAHLLHHAIDPQWPTSLSPRTVGFIKQMKFDGLVITDDLDMKALRLNFSQGDIAVLALRAGMDLLLYCNDPSSPPLGFDQALQALRTGHLDLERLRQSHQRICDKKRKQQIVF